MFKAVIAPLLGVISGACFVPFLIYGCIELEMFTESVIGRNPSLAFLAYVKNAIQISSFILVLVLPVVMWKRNRLFSLALIFWIILLGAIFIPGLFYR